VQPRVPGLEPDERLLAHTPASFRGATAASVRATFALGAEHRRLAAYYAWCEHAEVGGFATDGPEMVLGLTDTRIVVWSTTFWLGRPAEIAGRIPLTKIGDVATTRHGMVTGLALALTSGQIIEVEALRGRRLRRFADAVRAALAGNSR
jgi:hypothetical protein